MHFAILWKNKNISLRELQLIKPTNIDISWNIVFFDIPKNNEKKNTNKLSELWWIIKRGRVITEQDIAQELTDIKIIGVPNKEIGLKRKRQFSIKRYKITELNKTDREIKNKWKEFLKLPHSRIWAVDGYQNIPLYEAIDFEKPARSMQMWMMPAKLTHILINIGRIYAPQAKTISDPFAWTGTTWFLANHLWFNFIGSDLRTDYLEENITRRKTTKFHNKNFSLTSTEQDATKNTEPTTAQLIITEWRLGPIVTKNTTTQDIKTFQKQVELIYKKRIQNIHQTNQTNKPTIITTIPYYINQANFLATTINTEAQNLWRKTQAINEIYHRANQKVWRQILIFSL